MMKKKCAEYMDHLAVLISNLRMAYDMDIILGGDVGGVHEHSKETSNK